MFVSILCDQHFVHFIIQNYPNIITDHEGIFVHSHCVKEQQTVITKWVYDFRNIDGMGLQNYIKSLDFGLHVFCKPVHQQAEALSNILISAQKQFVPIQQQNKGQQINLG